MKTTQRACYVCGSRGNRIVASEKVEERYGTPLLPEGRYDFVRCRECGTLYVDSDVSDQYLSGIYEQESLSSTEVLLAGFGHDNMLRRRLPEFRRHWQEMREVRAPRAGDRLLDLGAQTGDFGAIAQEDGVVPNGIELSESYAATCQARWGPASRVHLGPAELAPFEPSSFEYISAFETLEHMVNPIGMLQQLKQWLTPDGVFAMSVPSSDYFHFKYWLLTNGMFGSAFRKVMIRRLEFYRNQILPHTHIYNFSPRSVRLMLERAGFDVLHVGVTGYHGSSSQVLRAVSSTLATLTGNRVALAPSVLALARPRSAETRKSA